MFLFILESIGTSELILIAVVALIIFGPRKLPQMAKTIGKTMAEFRNATNEFKSTWEKEVAFEENEDKSSINKNSLQPENPVLTGNYPNQTNSRSENENSPPAPEIKELSASDVAKNFNNEQTVKQNSSTEANEIKEVIPNKRNWL